jgi:hypothetical protein
VAIVTKTLGEAVEAAGTATLQVDYDDQRLRLSAIRIINTHPTLTARLTATSTSTAATFSLDGPPNQTSVQNVPAGQASKFGVTIDSRGRLDGVDYAFGWLV